MFSWLTSRYPEQTTATGIYGAIVTHARQPGFFSRCGVSDTPEGRFEMIALAMFTVLERLRQTKTNSTELQRALVETFVTDMDDCMREMGVGDLTVPRKVKKAAAGLMERIEQYRPAAATSSANELAAAISTNIPGVSATATGAREIADSVRRDLAHLATLPDATVLRGDISFAS